MAYVIRTLDNFIKWYDFFVVIETQLYKVSKENCDKSYVYPLSKLGNNDSLNFPDESKGKISFILYKQNS